LTDNSTHQSDLDPELRERLLQESRNPFKGLLRLLWIVLFGSSCIGIFVMSLRSISGQIVPLSDFAIQTCALLVFGFLVFYRPKNNY